MQFILRENILLYCVLLCPLYTIFIQTCYNNFIKIDIIIYLDIIILSIWYSKEQLWSFKLVKIYLLDIINKTDVPIIYNILMQVIFAIFLITLIVKMI